MRVITGIARGRRLKEPANLDIRPTTDQVKESMFSIIQFNVEGRRVLDLFAGTGQLGIEALSRGAESCTFVDERREAVAIIRENLDHCKLSGEVRQTEALSFLEGCGSYGLIFLDPPYASGFVDKALRKIFKFDILSDGGIIVCETALDATLPAAEAPYYKGKEYRYGKIKLTIYGKSQN